MLIKVHLGTHQIGGCITEIKTDNARIFIDMGAELPGTENHGSFDIDGVTTGSPKCDAVFITHDVLITEGTSLSRESKTHLDEGELQMFAKRILNDKKYVFALCASTNIDRIAAFYHATPRVKYFLCDDYQKKILDVISKYSGNETVLYNFQKAPTYGKNLDEKIYKHGFCMLVRCGDYFQPFHTSGHASKIALKIK